MFQEPACCSLCPTQPMYSQPLMQLPKQHQVFEPCDTNGSSQHCRLPMLQPTRCSLACCSHNRTDQASS